MSSDIRSDSRSCRDIPHVTRHMSGMRDDTAMHVKLIDAIIVGNFDLTRSMLERHHDILRFEYGEPALHCAARLGHVKLVELLLSYHADIECQDEHDRTVMFKAVMADNALEVIDVLQKWGASAISYRSRDADPDQAWTTPMWLAAEMRKLDVVKRLLQVDKDTLKWVIRDCARTDGANARNVVAARRIVECGPDSECIVNALHLAAIRGCLAIFGILENRHPELATQRDSIGQTPLHIAADQGWADIVEHLLDHHPDTLEEVNSRKWTALHLAAHRGHHNIVDTLLRRNANTTAQTETGYMPIFLSCFEKHDQTAMFLVKAMTRKQLLLSDTGNNHRDTLLRIAALGNCHQVVRLLIQYAEDNGTSFQALSNKTEGRTICYDTIALGHNDTVNVLLKSGASTDGSDEHGNTALHWAVSWGMRDAILHLLRDQQAARTALKIQNKKGETPVIRAAASAHIDLVPLLLEREDPQPVSGLTTTGWQALHWAARYQRLDLVRLMVANGAAVSVLDSQERSPAEIARHTEPNSIEMLEWLNPPKVKNFMDLLPTLTRPQADMCDNSSCRTAVTHIVGLYPTRVIQKSDFSVQSLLYEYGPNKLMTAVSAARQVDEQLDFRWIHMPANNKTWTQDLLQFVHFDRKEVAKTQEIAHHAQNNSRHSSSPIPESREDDCFQWSDEESVHSTSGKRYELVENHRATDESLGSRRSTECIAIQHHGLEVTTPIGVSNINDEDRVRLHLQDATSPKAIETRSLHETRLRAERAVDSSQQNVEADNASPAHQQDCSSHTTTEESCVEICQKSHSEESTQHDRVICDEEILHSKVRSFMADHFSQEAGPLHSRYLQPCFKWKKIRIPKLREETDRVPSFMLSDRTRTAGHRNTRIHKSAFKDIWIAICMPYFTFIKLKDLNNLKHEGSGIHLPLTLDQYHYHSLPGTENRTKDQVLFRHQMAIPEPERFICIVGHLWLHVMDDKTIVTSCWQEDGADAMNPPGDTRNLKTIFNEFLVQEKDRLPRELGVYAGILPFLGACARKTMEWEFGNNRERLLSAFSKTVAQAGFDEVSLFEEFETSLKRNDSPLPKDKKQFNSGVLPEIQLLKEIKDVLDELSIIETVLRSQDRIINDAMDFFRSVNGEDSNLTEFTNYYQTFSKVDATISELDKLKDTANHTQANIHYLLDLKQKDANISEAIWARKASEDTEKQSRTVMVFTVVTIIFLPSTFLTSLFALDITTFPHNSDGDLMYGPSWAFSMIFGITMAVSVPLIVVAFKVNEVSDFFSNLFKREGRRHKGPDPKKSTRSGNGALHDGEATNANVWDDLTRERMSLRRGLRRLPNLEENETLV